MKSLGKKLYGRRRSLLESADYANCYQISYSAWNIYSDLDGELRLSCARKMNSIFSLLRRMLNNGEL